MNSIDFIDFRTYRFVEKVNTTCTMIYIHIIPMSIYIYMYIANDCAILMWES